MNREDEEVIDVLIGSERYSDKLSEWEFKFLADISERDPDVLTEKQKAKIEQIWERVNR